MLLMPWLPGLAGLEEQGDSDDDADVRREYESEEPGIQPAISQARSEHVKDAISQEREDDDDVEQGVEVAGGGLTQAEAGGEICGGGDEVVGGEEEQVPERDAPEEAEPIDPERQDEVQETGAFQGFVRDSGWARFSHGRWTGDLAGRG